MNSLVQTQQSIAYQDNKQQEQLKVQVAELNEQNQALMMQYMAIMELYNQATADAEALKQASVDGRVVKEQLTRDLEEALKIRDKENAQLKAQIALLNSQFKEEKAQHAAELKQKDKVIDAKDRVIETKTKKISVLEKKLDTTLEFYEQISTIVMRRQAEIRRLQQLGLAPRIKHDPEVNSFVASYKDKLG